MREDLEAYLLHRGKVLNSLDSCDSRPVLVVSAPRGGAGGRVGGF